MKLKKLSSIVVACALLMTGCSGTATQENKNAGTDQSTSTAYPITITHAFGENSNRRGTRKCCYYSLG